MTQTLKKVKHDQEVVKLIGRLVCKDRKRCGMNQTELAPLLGIDQSALSRVESGKQALTAVQWFELSQAVGRDSNRLKLISRYLRMKPVLARMARAQERLSKERARSERSGSQRANKPKRKAVQNG